MPEVTMEDEDATQVEPGDDQAGAEEAAPVLNGEWQDIMSNGAVLKQIVRSSPIVPHVSPEFKQLVIVHVVGRTSKTPSRVFQNTREENSPITTPIGDQVLDYLPPGLMLCVRTMGVGEIARVKLQSRFAFGHGGHWFGLEPDTDVEYEVELLHIGDYSKEVPDMTADELAETVRKYKNRGNEWFKWNELEKALRCYKEGARFGDGALQHMEDEKRPITLDIEVVKDRLACLNNIATVFEKQGKLKEAMETTVSVLEADPRHLKSLIRAARVAVLQGSHEEAQAAVAAAVEIAPTNDAVIKVRRELDERIARHKVQEKERWGGFLKPVPKEEAERLRQEQSQRFAKEMEEKARTAEQIQAMTEGKGMDLAELQRLSKQQTEKTSQELEDMVKQLVEKSDQEDAEDEGDQQQHQAKPLITPEMLELFARLIVLLSPTIVSLIALLIWRVFAV